MCAVEIPYPAKIKAFCEFLFFFVSWQYFPVILLKDYGNHQAAASLLRDRYDRVSSRRRMMVIYVPKRPFSFLSFLSSYSSSVYSFLVSFPPCATLFTYFSQVFLSKQDRKNKNDVRTFRPISPRLQTYIWTLMEPTNV